MTAAISATNFEFPGQQGFYRGKVRDVYYFDDLIAVIASDRISAFDVVLPRAIPYKGQVLNQIAAGALEATSDLVPNWFIASPHPQVTVGHKCQPIPVEMVIRGYLAGHAWRVYQSGKRTICGVPLPNGLKENDPLPQPIITPTTKASSGHDQDISKDDILRQNLVSDEIYQAMEQYTLALYDRGSALAAGRDLILVDTKYEFGLYGDQVMLIDEIHTPDSSRYFYRNTYQQFQDTKQPQKQLSKEFVRKWLISLGFQGQEGQDIPAMDDQVVNSISERYIELYEKFMGIPFKKPSQPVNSEDLYKTILESIQHTLSNKI